VSILGNLLGLSPTQAQLGWTFKDVTTSKVTIRVIIFDATGNVVRQLDGGTFNNPTPGSTVSGSTAWDGKDQTLTGIIGVGVYYYRVVAMDDAGNISQSGESKPIQVKLSLLGL
jgi:hypothetical protein